MSGTRSGPPSARLATALMARHVAASEKNAVDPNYLLRFAKTIAASDLKGLPNFDAHPQKENIKRCIEKLTKARFDPIDSKNQPDRTQFFHPAVTIVPFAESVRVSAEALERVAAREYGYLFIAAKHYASCGSVSDSLLVHKIIEAFSGAKAGGKKVTAGPMLLVDSTELFGVPAQDIIVYVFPHVVIAQAKKYAQDLQKQATGQAKKNEIKIYQHNDFVPVVRDELKKINIVPASYHSFDFSEEEAGLLFTRVMQGLWEQTCGENKPFETGSTPKLLKQLETLFETGGVLYKDYTRKITPTCPHLNYHQLVREHLPSVVGQIARSAMGQPRIVVHGSTPHLPATHVPAALVKTVSSANLTLREPAKNSTAAMKLAMQKADKAASLPPRAPPRSRVHQATSIFAAMVSHVAGNAATLFNATVGPNFRPAPPQREEGVVSAGWYSGSAPPELSHPAPQ
jgi:hypothetical protein